MKHLQQVSLRAFNTFGTEAFAGDLLQLEQLSDLQLLADRQFRPSYDLILGGGSNILFAGNVPGTVFLNRIRGREVVEIDNEFVYLDVASGESWHELVRWTVEQGYSGLENLSLIPGLAGAAPMQNIGAYGVEISEHLHSVRVWDWQNARLIRLNREACQFGYRDSVFKGDAQDRYLIVSCRLKLHCNFQPRLHYAGLQDELKAMNINSPNALDVSNAVIRLRERKLPDPRKIGNAGSFFKNPEISAELAEQLTSNHPGLPVYKTGTETCKLSAAWMIEACGWKGFRKGDAGVSSAHALVLVNHGTAHGRDIHALSLEIRQSVFEEFGIQLNREPVLFKPANETKSDT